MAGWLNDAIKTSHALNKIINFMSVEVKMIFAIQVRQSGDCPPPGRSQRLRPTAIFFVCENTTGNMGWMAQ